MTTAALLTQYENYAEHSASERGIARLEEDGEWFNVVCTRYELALNDITPGQALRLAAADARFREAISLERLYRYAGDYEHWPLLEWWGREA